jgi:hypothetical protein
VNSNPYRYRSEKYTTVLPADLGATTPIVGFTPNDLLYFQLPIYHHFGLGNFYVQEIRDIWNWKLLFSRWGKRVIRSSFDNKLSLDQSQFLSCKLLLRYSENCFLYFEGRKLQVYSETPEEALLVIQEVCSTFRKRRSPKNSPCFHLLKFTKMGVESSSIPISQKRAFCASTLNLLYGETFGLWESETIKKLKISDMGMTLLQGEPGTGKTSFIRHLMAKLHKTHRFYVLPSAHFSMLSRPDMVSFWSHEMISYPHDKKVIILEDAESMLQKRSEGNHDTVSNFLNIADGLLGEFLRMHLLCTINCDLDQLDPAILRHGRLHSHRKFHRLNKPQAERIAEHHGLSLSEQETYSLAEIFKPDPLIQIQMQQKRIGF